MAEFRISSLRYNYVGIWQSGTVYAIDDIVYFEGQLYSCNLPHTATNFNSDLITVGQIDKVDFFRWTKVVNGQYFKYAWAPTTTYNLNNLVSYGGAIWLCNTYHVSTIAFDTAKFTLLIEGAKWSNNWTISTPYGVGQVVRYGGIVYTCNTNHVSAINVDLGLEADQSKWTSIYAGIDFKGAWTSGVRYKLNDVLKVNASLYICTIPHTSTSTFNSSNFEVWLPTYEFQNQWSSGVNYQLNDIVIYGGNAWVSISNNNFNNAPNNISIHWNVLNPSYNFKVSPWSFTSNYRVGDVVLYRSRLFRAVANSQGNNPVLTAPPLATISKTVADGGISTTNSIELEDATGIQNGFALAGPEQYNNMNLAEYRVANVVNDVVYFDKPLASAISVVGTASSWILEYGDLGIDAEEEYPSMVAHDSVGNIYVIGGLYFNTTSTYILKLDQSGNILWQKDFNILGKIKTGDCIAVDSNDDVIATFSTDDGTNSVYVIKLDGSGSIIWQTELDMPPYLPPYSQPPVSAYNSVDIAIDSNDDIIIGLNYISQGTSFFTNNISLTTVKLDSLGVLQWQRRLGGDSYQRELLGISVDSANNVYVCGIGDPTTDEDQLAPVDLPGQNKVGILAKYNSTGVLQWQKYIGDPIIDSSPTSTGTDWLRTIAVDSDDNIYVAGMIDYQNFSIVKLNSSGIIQWQKEISDGLPLGQYPHIISMSIDSSNNLYLFGHRSTVASLAVIKLDSSGDLIWQRDISNSSSGMYTYYYYGHRNISIFNNLIVVGAYAYPPGASYANLFLARLPTDGSLTGTYSDYTYSTIIDYTISNSTHDIQTSLMQEEAGDLTPIYAITATMSNITTVSDNLIVISGSAGDVMFQGWNQQYWQVLAQSENFRGFWNSNSQSYVPGDVVIYKNNTWRCVVANASSSFFPPDYVFVEAGSGLSDGRYWTVHLPHAQQNALINQGDIVYNSVNGRDVRTNLAVGSETYQLQSNNGLPTYNRILTSPNVYYVSLDGIDDPAYGVTWDQPWRTIQYAVQNAVGPGTIFIKSGTFEETLPIVVPEYISLVGDELRSVTVKPATVINTYVYSSTGSNDRFQTYSTENMVAGMPVQFVFQSNDSPVILSPFESNNISAGVEYYVKEVFSDTEFSISNTPIGVAIGLSGGTGLMQVIGGDAIKNMFLMQNSTGMRNMTLIGLLGTLTDENEFGTRRPTGGSFVSLDPGSGPGDTNVWISTRSPYIQNVTAFGTGAIGIKIDGTLHNGGNKSIVANDFTHIIGDGIGVWCTGSGALTELVSIFSYYGYAGYFAEDGGRIRATNGNSSYGVFGVIAEGFDATESPITGIIYNRQYSPEPKILTVKGLSSNTQRINFNNAGKHYTRLVTNLLKYSNNFQTAPWQSDGFVTFSQNTSDPYDKTTLAWAITGTSATAGSGFIYQTVNVTPSGATYTDVTGSNLIGNGNGATFTISVKATGYEITAITGTPFLGGQGYAEDDEILISGNQLGGITGVHDATIVVQTIVGNSIATATITGDIPEITIQNYTFSVHVKPSLGNDKISLAAEFSGASPNEIRLQYNLDNFTVTTTSVQVPVNVPTQYGINEVDNGWYRLWFRTYDKNALNNLVTFKIYAKEYSSPAGGSSYIYGAQVENTPLEIEPGFYLSSKDKFYSAYADFLTSGAGTGLVTIGEEIRSNGIYRTRLIDPGQGLQIGGTGYQTASNNGQGGNSDYIILAGSDVAASSTYLGLRVIIVSGKGVGQYGLITNYDPDTKYAHVAKESYDPITIISSNAATNKLNLDTTTDIDLLYTGMPVTFYPTVYTTTVRFASKTSVIVTTVTGGQSNTMSTANISQLYNNMPVSFEQTGIFGGVVSNFTYYVINLTSTTFQLSTTIFGTPIFLLTGTGTMTMNIVSNTSYFYATSTASMTPNMSLQFTGGAIGGTSTGTVYYVNDVIDNNFFSISTSLTETEATAVSSGTNYITIDSTVGLVQLFPIVFHGTSLDTILAGTKYYISKIIGSNTITISETLYRTITRSTDQGSNLIYADTTAGFVIGNPIKFVGIAFGNLLSENIYYVSRVISNNLFQIATSASEVSVTITATDGATNYITGLTNSFTELYPIRFVGSGLSGSGLSTSSTYYVSKVIDSNNFTVSSTLISVNVTGTTAGTNQITCATTNGFQVDNPVIFYGDTIGGLVSGTVYYILQIDNLITFRVSSVPGGGAFPLSSASPTTSITANTPGADADLSSSSTGTLTALTVDTGTIVTLTDATGYLITETTGIDKTLSNDTGLMAVQSTPSKTNLITSSGSITALYNSNFIEGIAPATTYYIETIDSVTKSVTIEDSIGGTQVDIQTSNYSMQMVVAGWDHFVPGSEIELLLDTTTQYFIEPRPVYSHPEFSQLVLSFPTQSVAMSNIGYGDNKFVALTPGLNKVVYSEDTVTWNEYVLPVTAAWSSIAFGNGYWVLISSGGAGASTALFTTNPESSWRQSQLPSSATWTSVVYGEGLFVALDSTLNSNKVAYSVNYGRTWIASTLPAPNPAQWISLVFGNGRFIALSSNSNRTAISYNGVTWIEGGVLPTSSAWSSISYGNGRFVAVSSADTTKAAWSFDGLTWSSSLYDVRATRLAYGQGIFLAVRNNNTLAYTSEDGIIWKKRTVSGTTYSGLCFGYTGKNIGTVSNLTIVNGGSGYDSPPLLRFAGGGASVQATATCSLTNGVVTGITMLTNGVGYTEPPTIIVTPSLNGTTASFTPQMIYNLDEDSYTGLFVTAGSTSIATAINAGVRAKARVEITSGIITDFYSWEPGSGYSGGSPSLSIYDTNSTQIAQTDLEIGNGVLGHPLIVSTGIGYSATRTDIVVNGQGYAEEYQAEYNLVLDAASSQPSVGSNLVITGLSEIYKVTDITVLDNSSAPNLRLRIGINPPLSALQSPHHATSFIIREKYSQVRLTGHDFLNIGFGDQYQSGYPSFPTDPDAFLRPFNQTAEVNYGRVFYTSTDQDGNFKTGNFFGVEQATGIVTLSASQFGLEGLTQLKLGGIAVGSQSVIITQISTDSSMIDNSDSIISTQKAIKTYIANRLSQGGSNVVTSTMNAGTVVIGGQNKIGSTVPAGQLNSSVVFSDKVLFEGVNSGVDGDMASWYYYIGQGVYRN